MASALRLLCRPSLSDACQHARDSAVASSFGWRDVALEPRRIWAVSLADMARLLIVHHSPTHTVQALTDAVVAGANDDAIEGVDVVVRAALEATRRRRARRPTATCSGRPRTSAT